MNWHAKITRKAFAAALFAAAVTGSCLQAGVREASFAEPTQRYAHGVLGDDVEYGALSIVTDQGHKRVLRLPQDRVFEDIEIRLVDVDLDADQEIVVVESSAAQGARLAIYDENGLVAATPYIGQRFRWLAPLGAADLDGDGAIELAYVDRPHLAKVLRIWRFEPSGLRQVAQMEGLTNHRIGQDFISGGLRQCGADPEIIVMSADWSAIHAVTYKEGQLRRHKIGSYQGRASAQNALRCP